MFQQIRPQGKDALAEISIRKDAYKYQSFMRDEVYPIEVGFKLPNGQITHFTHIPNNNPLSYPLSEIAI